MLEAPPSAVSFGFVNSPHGGTHTGRTMLLADLRLLMAACPRGSDLSVYHAAVVKQNVLLKNTMITRRNTYSALRELYALDENVLVFRLLRELWDDDADAHPILALLSAVARDPVLRSTADFILETPTGAAVTSAMLTQAAEENMPGRYRPSVLAVVGRETASSWQQAGHLRGSQRKQRAQADSRQTALVYALVLGHLCGVRGESLFHTLWCRLLDAPQSVLHTQAVLASQRGWIDYRSAGDVTEVSFSHLLRGGIEEVAAVG